MSSEDQTKYALVTGASSGIGKATAKELASRGFKVFACARRVDQMEDLVKYGIEPIGLDVTDQKNVEQVKKIVELKTGGRLDILYNNAGQSCTIPAIDADDERISRCFEVNVFAPIRMTREFSAMLIKAKGCVAFTGSLAGLAPFPWSSIYCSTKAALHQYVAVLHLELKPFGVKVLNIVTGGVNTSISDRRPLSESSFYYCEEGIKAFEERQNMVKNHKPMSPEVFAKKIVNDMLSSSDPLNVYRGSQATYVSLVMAWLPTCVVEFFFQRHFRLNPLFTYLRAKFSKDHQE